MGGTTLALPRRRRDAALWSRVLRGRAIDIGGGPDPLQTDAAWPALTDVMVWDLPNDGHDLSQFADGSFDTVYSSHCIEHLAQPVAAIAEWWRVLRPGGHLVVVAPDFTLYERGHWPSRFNTDHRTGWSTCLDPASPLDWGVRDLLAFVFRATSGPMRTVSYRWLVEGFNPDVDHDQTATGTCECGIELVLQKLSKPISYS